MARNPYAVVGPGERTAPQYARVVASLSDREIRTELDSERGRTDEGWRAALLAEQKKRSGA